MTRSRALIGRLAGAALPSVLSALLVAGAVGAVPPDRGDLGAAYLRFEQSVARAPASSEARRSANLEFDALTGDFFAGRYDRALAKLAEIEGDVAGEAPDAPAREERAFLAGHRVVVEPRTGRVDGPSSLVVRAMPLDGMRRGVAPTHLVLRQAERVVVSDARDLCGEGQRIAAVPAFLPGAVEVLARFTALGDVPVGRAYLFGQEPASLRDELARSIDELAAAGRSDPSTIASLRGRLDLAFGAFDRGKSADFLADPVAIASSLGDEIAIASDGGRPYGRAGDTWRILRVLGTELPVRQFVPDGEGPFPLVVAFHGAGGDENLFFDGYGGGRLLELARERAFVAVCPPTIPFGLSPNMLVKFLEELRREIAFDETRVLLVGHSLGAATASRLSVLKPDAIAGAACIAGFADIARKVDPAPRRVYLAELDPLFPLEGTRATVEAARARGESVNTVVVPGEGHTLVVGEVLPQAIDWLLALEPRKIAKTPPTQSAPTTPAMNTGVPAPKE